MLWWDTMLPKEGCRCLLHDEERHLLYALSYPRDHFFIYDTKKRTRRDVGRIGSINAQTLFLDRKHRVWTTDDYGHLVRYDPEKDRLERSPFVLPHNPEFQTGWHSVFYDVAAAPDGECVYAATWIAASRLMRIWPNEGEWPRVEDLGPATQKRDPTLPKDTFVDHCGGLVFAGDGQLYYVASRWRDPVYNPMPADGPEREGVVWRLEPRHLAAAGGGGAAPPDAAGAIRFPRRSGPQRQSVLRRCRHQAGRHLQSASACLPEEEECPPAYSDVGMRIAMSESTKAKYDMNSPEAKALIDEIVHGTFTKEGTMAAFPTCFPGASIPIPADESHITALDVSGDGMIYGGTSGRATHLFVGIFHGVTEGWSSTGEPSRTRTSAPRSVAGNQGSLPASTARTADGSWPADLRGCPLT